MKLYLLLFFAVINGAILRNVTSNDTDIQQKWGGHSSGGRSSGFHSSGSHYSGSRGSGTRYGGSSGRTGHRGGGSSCRDNDNDDEDDDSDNECSGCANLKAPVLCLLAAFAIHYMLV